MIAEILSEILKRIFETLSPHHPEVTNYQGERPEMIELNSPKAHTHIQTLKALRS